MPSHLDAIRTAAAKMADARAELDEAVIAAIDDGVKQATVAKAAGISRQSVYERYVKHRTPEPALSGARA